MSIPSGPSRRELYRLLNRYNEYPAERPAVVAQIEKEFQQTIAIMVVDSCSFSAKVQAQGIIHFLALLERIERLILPHIERNNGRLLREDADNFYAAFADPDSALKCASDVCHDIEVANSPLPAADEIYVSIGIGYGEVLCVGSDDLFGDEMNLSCKLGEDLAGEDEILLTGRAHAALKGPSWEFEEKQFSVSGLSLTAFQVKRETAVIKR